MLFNPFGALRLYGIHARWFVVSALLVAAGWKAYRWWILRRSVRALQRIVQEMFLPLMGLRLTTGKQTADDRLLDYQVSAKATANRYGFKVEQIPGWDESQIPGWDEHAEKTGAKPRCPSPEEYSSEG